MKQNNDDLLYFKNIKPRGLVDVPKFSPVELKQVGSFSWLDYFKNWANIIKALKFLYKVVKFIITEFKNDFVAYDSRVEKLLNNKV